MFIPCQPSVAARLLCALPLLLGGPVAEAQPQALPFPSVDEPSLALPVPGSRELRLLSPSLLELTLITTNSPSASNGWDFISAGGQLRLPDAREFEVKVAGENIPVRALGFRRRVLYAPLKQRDLRVGNSLYLQLTSPVPEDNTVEILNPPATLWPADVHLSTSSSPLRWSPVIHANQTGYLQAFPKVAMVGCYLGSLGELDLNHLQPASPLGFKLLQASTGQPVFAGRLRPRPDKGFPFPCYQQVLEADFTEFKTPGEYRLQVPGLGVSHPFFINDGVAAAFARTYALGLYHQRCGASNSLPFTRFIHGPCHNSPASIPLPETNFAATWKFLAQANADAAKNPRHTAPRLTNNATSLYPFVKRGKIDVSGGHHDAGDYSKYTINSAGLIHHLVFAADVFPGVADLDNLGLPESGDGRSDLLQEAKWEADFLAKMQDDDSYFYFLVYPRNREYESDVPCDKGDPQVV